MLDYKETYTVFKGLHINVTYKYLTQYFKKYDIDNNNNIDFNEFKALMLDITKK